MTSDSQDALTMLLRHDERWMQLALEQARFGQNAGEVPVGAVVIKDSTVVGSGYNRNLLDRDPTAHAEMVAMREAGLRLGNHRLNGCTLYCTIEPCAMCAGAMIHARVERLVFGASDPKAGAAGSVLEVINHPALNHQMKVTAGVLREESSALLKAFFLARRRIE